MDFQIQFPTPLGTARVSFGQRGIREACFVNDTDPKDKRKADCVIANVTEEALAKVLSKIQSQDLSQIKKAVRCFSSLSPMPRPTLGFSPPLELTGTAFQVEVWNQIRQIPFGKTKSYQWIANQLARPAAVRAVANACGSNTIAFLVPCHRVIRSNGELGGYRWGIHLKQRLLEWENEKALHSEGRPIDPT